MSSLLDWAKRVIETYRGCEEDHDRDLVSEFDVLIEEGEGLVAQQEAKP